MPAKYEIWLANDAGIRLDLLDENHGFYYTRICNQIGNFNVKLPSDFDQANLARDRRILFYRQPKDATNLRLEFIGLLRRWRWETDERGKTTLNLWGVDLNTLLNRRIVAYTAGSSQAAMSTYADDMMKEIVTDNLGGDATAARDWTNAGLSIQANNNAGPSIAKSFAWRNVLLLLQDLSKAAKTAGHEVFFDIVPVTESSFEFRTWIDQRGTDRTWSTGVQPVIFGLGFGNLQQPFLEYDYSTEVTYTYAGGQGEGSNRDVQEAEDTTRSGASVFNRCEAFAYAQYCETTAKTQDVADQALAEGEPIARFGGILTDNKKHRYGINWFYGDRVTATYMGRTFNNVIRSMTVGVDGNKREIVEGRMGID